MRCWLMKSKTKHRISEYDINYPPKPTFLVSGKSALFCDRVPGVMLQCENDHQCYRCEYAERLKFNFNLDPPPYPIINESSVFSDKRNVSYNFYGKVVAVKPETLERLELKQLLYYQFFMCDGGPGCLPGNDMLEVDGHFLALPDRAVTLKRKDILGIPMLDICKRYDKYFFANTVRECGYYTKGDGAYDCGENAPDTISDTQLTLKF